MNYLNKISLLKYTPVLFFICVLISACGSDKNDHPQQAEAVSDTASKQTMAPPGFSSKNIEIRTFEITDSTTKKSQGWGYDIYVDNARVIHQSIIPAIQGNKAFSTEEKAKLTGTFAMNKMKQTGSLPTLTIAELDSLGVTK